MKNKTCQHWRLDTFRGGGRDLAQCLDCFDYGLEQRLRRDRRERCPRHRRRKSGFCRCGKYMGD